MSSLTFLSEGNSAGHYYGRHSLGCLSRTNCFLTYNLSFDTRVWCSVAQCQDTETGQENVAVFLKESNHVRQQTRGTHALAQTRRRRERGGGRTRTATAWLPSSGLAGLNVNTFHQMEGNNTRIIQLLSRHWPITLNTK